MLLQKGNSCKQSGKPDGTSVGVGCRYVKDAVSLYDYLTYQPYVWYRSDSVLKNESDRVYQLTDLSGNGRNQTQDLSGRFPLWEDNKVNGHPWINFDEDYFEGDPSWQPFSNVGGMTIFAVFDSDASGDAIVSKWRTGNDARSFLINSGSMNISSSGANSDSLSNTIDYNMKVWCWRWQPGQMNIRKDKVSVENKFSTYETLYEDLESIGLHVGKYGTLSDNALDGKLCELIIYPYWLYSAACDVIETALKERYDV